MLKSSGPPTSARMKTTAGPIRTAARMRRSSKRSRQRVLGRAWATATTAAAILSDLQRSSRKPVAEIQLERLTKVYPDGTLAVSALDLEIADSEFVVLVGPSGCGKTTALRMVAGLEAITEGVVRIGGRVVNKLPPKDRDIAMVFQNYALYPHMSAFRNMAFGLKMRKVARPAIGTRVKSAAQVLGLEKVLDKRPRTLSGGQRQRVAMGRAMVGEPQAFLMDEPLSNLDAKLRVQMRAEIARIQRSLGVTTIYVTHDQSEAMTLGDRVCVLRDGVLQQVDSAQKLYDEPANLFVAEFIGSPAMNLVDAEVVRANGRVGAPPIRTKAVAGAVGEEALEAMQARSRREGSLFVARLAQGTAAREGEPVELAVKTKRLHFFDPVTGDAIYAEEPY